MDYHPPTCELAKRSNFDSIIMSAPTFTTLPREIRNRIYDFVWDLGKPVAPTGWSSSYMPHSMRRSYPFDRVPINAILTLLHVNHQISAEAASTFYSQRKFYSAPNPLVPFLKGIALHRHLIKDIEVLQVPGFEMRFSTQIFNFLKTLDGLRSFTMRIDTDSFHRFQEHLIEAGMHKLMDRIVFTVHTEHTTFLDYTKADSYGTLMKERIVFTNALTYAKGGKKWKIRGFHCRVISRQMVSCVIGAGLQPLHVPSQPCNHDHHRPGRYYDIERFLIASA